MRRTILFSEFLYAFFVFILAILSTYIVQFKGGGYDADRFYQHAGDWISHGNFELVFDSEAFIQLVGIYRLIGIDQAFSAYIGFLLLFGLVIYITKNLPITFLFIIISYYCYLSPSAILRVPVLLREPYVMFGLLFSIYLLSKNILNQKFLNLNFFISFFVLLFFSVFHKAAIVFIPVVITLYILFFIIKDVKGLLWVLIIFALLGTVFFQIVDHLPSGRGTQVLLSLASGDFDTLSRLADNKSSRDFQSTYSFDVDYTSFFGILKTIIISNFYYYFKPFVTDIKDLPTLFLFVENIVRVLFLMYLVKIFIKEKSVPALFVLASYLLFNMIWAMGTFNFGTGSRHHWASSFILFALLPYYKRKSI